MSFPETADAFGRHALRHARLRPCRRGLAGVADHAVPRDRVAGIGGEPEEGRRRERGGHGDDDEGEGGLDFPGQRAPDDFDFAYFAFTVGMCFQSSDVVIKSRQIRRAVLRETGFILVRGLGRMERVPIILFGTEFWKRAIDLDYLAEQGTISPGDQDIIDFVDSADDAWKIIQRFYNL